MQPYSGKWVTRVIAFLLFSEVGLSSLSLLFNSPTQTPVRPPRPAVPKSITTHLCQRRRDSESGALSCPRSPRHQWTSDGGNAWLQRNLHEIKFSTWLTGVTRPGLLACSFIIPGLITDWTGCLVCLMPAQLLHGRNRLVTLCYNTLYYHLHFIYLAQISRARQPARPSPPPQHHLPLTPQRHLQFTTAQPSASVRKLFKITCLKFSLKCHLDVTLTV